jgi:ABC-type Fe3+-hydroxamate transport system substrate-binding protein
MNKKIKSLVATSTILVLLSACASISSSNLGNITSSIVSSAQVSVEQPLALNQIELVAVEVDKLPNRVVYTPTDVVSTSGGVLRVVYSDYRVR